MSNPIYEQALRDAADLVRALGNSRRGTIELSAHTAELLQSLSAQSAPPVESAVASADAPTVSDDPSALQALAEEVAACTKCGLCEGRTQTVFSDGSPTADLVFVGEAPGENEDKQGVPFVGRAGALLTDIIVKGMQLQREDVYICNVIKCRPPENRDPSLDEKQACEPYLVRQLELVQPKVICALGGHAAKTLLKTDESTGRLRGRWHFYHGIPLRVTYHPAYLLRSPSEKAKTWADIQEVIKVLNGEISPQPSGQDSPA